MAEVPITVFDCTTPERPIPMGSFQLQDNSDGRFQYYEKYRQQLGAFSLDPTRLPLVERELSIPKQPDGTYAVLSDAGPNAWGMKLKSHLLCQGRKPMNYASVDWFLDLSNFGSGCLSFTTHSDEPPQIRNVPGRSSDLCSRLLDALDRYLAHPEAGLDTETEHLLCPGSDLGGWRPKTTVMHEGIEHIAKFSRPDDIFDIPTAEYAALRIAHLAGITVPLFELVSIGAEGRTALLVERFDRTVENRRIHYQSAYSLLQPGPLSADRREYKTSFSYAAIAEALLLRNNAALEDAHELFRRMVLNIMIGNIDDHLRNHAVLMREHSVYRLSPAFDICPHLEAPFRGQNIGVGAFGTASTVENAISHSTRFSLTVHEAKQIVAEVKDVASRWRLVFADSGVSERDRRRLSDCFAIADEATATQVGLGTLSKPECQEHSNNAVSTSPTGTD